MTRVEELQLPARIKRLQALDTRALGARGMPDEFVGHGHAGECLPFSEHELSLTGRREILPKFDRLAL